MRRLRNHLQQREPEHHEQQSQGEAAITQGANVLVLDAVDATAVGSVVKKANEENIPVISYDRLILGAPVDYYVSFDNERVGELQAETLREKLKEEGSPQGPIVMINGSPTDPNAAQFKAGAKKILEQEGTNVAKEYDTPEWSPDQAQNEMEQAITALRQERIRGCLRRQRRHRRRRDRGDEGSRHRTEIKPTTGQDAELEAIQRILVGEQFMTVYKAITPETHAAAEIAVALAEGKRSPPDWSTPKKTTKPKRCHRSCSNRWR